MAADKENQSSKTSDYLRQRTSTRQIWRHCCGKVTWLMLAVVGGLFILMSLADDVENVMGREAEGVFSIFASPPTDLDLASCSARVPLQQAYLYEEARYYDFFRQSHAPNVIVEPLEGVCDEGFRGTQSLYGLGIRGGLYMLWFSYVIADHIQLNMASTILQAAMAYQIVNIASIFAMTFRGHCVFSAEVVIMLFLLQGGAIIAVRKPSILEDSGKPKWTGITFTRLLDETTSYANVIYQAWFWIWGFDGHFIEWPCGAFDFLGKPTNGLGFRSWRAMMGLICIVFALWLTLVLPGSVILFPEEYQQSFRDSNVYRWISGPVHSSAVQSETSWSSIEEKLGQEQRMSAWRQRWRSRLWFIRQRLFHELTVSKSVARFIHKNIISIRKLVFLIMIIAATEKLIQANKISGVDSIKSTGQYLSISVGIVTLIACLCSVVKTWSIKLEAADSQNNIASTSNIHHHSNQQYETDCKSGEIV